MEGKGIIREEIGNGLQIGGSKLAIWVERVERLSYIGKGEGS